MESMPCEAAAFDVPTVVPEAEEKQQGRDGWKSSLPVLANAAVTLRPLRAADAPSLFSMLGADEVKRFMSQPPRDVAGFERFIEWAQSELQCGRYACFAVVPAGLEAAVGLVQVRPLDPGFSSAEWGIAIGSGFWGTELFEATAALFLDFLFNEVGVHRLEGRAAVRNGRANGALRKIGAVQEGLLRRSMESNGEYLDQILWSILADDWRASRTKFRPIVH